MSDTFVHEPVQWRVKWKVEKYEGNYAYRPVSKLGRFLDKFGFGKLMLTLDEKYLPQDFFRSRYHDKLGFELYHPGKLIEEYNGEGNLLMYGGASVLWECLKGSGTTTAAQALTFFNNANAAIGVGDSTTAAAATHTDLQAASNKLRKAMDASYPTHTDGTTSAAASISFRSTFGTSDANYAWQEWGVFNSPTAATGRMLNRKVENLGTKTSAASWTFTVTLTLS